MLNAILYLIVLVNGLGFALATNRHLRIDTLSPNLSRNQSSKYVSPTLQHQQPRIAYSDITSKSQLLNVALHQRHNHSPVHSNSFAWKGKAKLTCIAVHPLSACEMKRDTLCMHAGNGMYTQ